MGEGGGEIERNASRGRAGGEGNGGKGENRQKGGWEGEISLVWGCECWQTLEVNVLLMCC